MTPQPSVLQQHRFTPGPTAFYAQLASVLRNRIMTGEWPPGTALPTLEELCTQYGLARITVRQALQSLASEGLISSQRGRRSHVIAPHDPTKPIFSSIASIEKSVPNYGIRVLARERVEHLPPNRWDLGHEEGLYVHIRKVDREGEQPYALSSIYLAEDVYKRLPKGADAGSKIAQLAVQHAKPQITSARERLSVEPAELDASSTLNCAMATPVARAERVFCNGSGRVIYYGVSIYRGDRFGLERDLTDYLRGD